MAEQWWRTLAETVPATLTQVSASDEAHRLVNVALWKLARQAEVVSRLRAGAGYYMPADIDLADPLPAGISPTEILDVALREVSRVRALLVGAHYAFVLYCKQAAIVRPGRATDPLFGIWDRHRAEAIHHANQALRRLRDAMSHAEAIKDVMNPMIVAGPTPRRDDWMMAAHHQAGLAMWMTQAALLDVQQMRHTVAMEHYDACMVLNHL